MPVKNRNNKNPTIKSRKIDRQCMELAIAQARKSKGEDERAHPKVGVVVVKEGKVINKGFRGETGAGDHAEYGVLEKKEGSKILAGATVYTTLEPCTTRKHPKIPCADRLIERKVQRVVIGMLDPNLDILGKGYQRLRRAGIAVALFDDDLMSIVEEINREFSRSHNNPKLDATSDIQLAKKFYSLRSWAQAEVAFRRVVKTWTNNAEAFSGLGSSLFQQGKLEESERAHRRSVELQSDIANYHVNLGDVLKNLKRFTEASAEYQKAIELEPDKKEWRERLNSLMEGR